MKTVVYFIRDGASIKIGITSDLTSRLATIRKDGHKDAEFIAGVRGNHALERALHKKLHQHALGGEWFRDCRDVQAAMQNTLNNFEQVDIDLPIRRNNSIMSEVARLLWPRNTAPQLASVTGCSTRAAEHWLSGSHDWPGVAVAAVIAEILRRHLERNVKVLPRA